MIVKKYAALLLVVVLLNLQLLAQKASSLAVSIPEKEGISSEVILNFVNAAEKSKTEFHSFMLLRHGKVIAQGWWNPYGPGLKHTLYSCSKSFTATAIGFAVSEKRLTVNDKVTSFFPGELPDSVSAFLSDLKVKDVLSMTDGQDPDPTGTVISRDSNWVKGFLALPILNQPGTKFLYNSLGTYMLSAIVQKVTGQRVIDYLRPRLFDPLGITGMDWEVDPKGINTGGWGLRVKTEDMAKFAQLFLQRGKWNGKQILPESWVEEASTAKIIQHPEYSQEKRDSSDWEQGYCYQMWRCRHNAYRGDGAFGQYMIVMPEQDAVIAITAESPSMQEEINLVWQYLLPAMQPAPLPANKDAASRLEKKLASLALAIPGKTTAAFAKELSGKTYTIEKNNKQVNSLSFHFVNDVCELTLKNDTAAFSLNFGTGKWYEGETTKHGPSLTGRAKASFAGLSIFKTRGVYAWKDEHTLVLVLRYIESPHTETITCHFEGDKISVDFENSLNVGGEKVSMNGNMQH